MAIEIFLLKRDRSEIPIAVEPGFAQCRDAGKIDHCGDLLPIARRGLVGRIGMNPDGGQQIVVFGQLYDGPARFGGDGGAEDRRDPGVTCPRDHLAAVGVEVRLIEMGVGVEVHGEMTKLRMTKHE